MLPIFQGLLNTAGPWAALFARSGLRLYPFQRGCKASANSTGTTATTFGNGTFAVNDYAMVCTKQSEGNANAWTPSFSRIAKVTTVGANSLTFDAALTVQDGDLIFNLGPDSGGLTPDLDGSSVALFEDEDGASAIPTAYILTGKDGSYHAFINASVFFVLVATVNGIPLSALGWRKADTALVTFTAATVPDANNWPGMEIRVKDPGVPGERWYSEQKTDGTYEWITTDTGNPL